MQGAKCLHYLTLSDSKCGSPFKWEVNAGIIVWLTKMSFYCIISLNFNDRGHRFLGQIAINWERETLIPL